MKEYKVLKPKVIGGVSYVKGQPVKLNPIDAQTYIAQGVVAEPAIKKELAKTTAEKTGDK